jgi:3-hydroxymyristoyl/3-hydroxydecanoyl-(acyl carrier protein) dehydratase
VTALVWEPQVLDAAPRAQAVGLHLLVPEQLQCFEGHFPGRPILPGVVQLAWAVALGREHLGLQADIGRITGLKFARIVRPGARLTLDLQWSPAQESLAFRYTEGRALCSCGHLFAVA